ncbi:glycosyltransferase family 4 protein [Patescibacteria group bacterium]|nr:glycosyltransferase family 4 protein [Patescibacteria group bacterium]MBU1683124.1 glycosyltransferase family 4 protein [Patescibacteria group bacterium]MBU1934588.1 glycosyltransferase family 4 protein [Patescibacteria group bacterium]
MKKILFYTDTPNIGGAEKQMLLLTKYLNKKSYSVSLAYGGMYSKINQMHDEFEKWCEKVYPLPTIHKHDPRHYTHLKKILKSDNFDLIHLHLWNPGSCRYAFFAAHHSNVPIVTTEHDPFELTGLKRLIKQNCLQKTAQTITISQDNFRLLGEYYGVPKNRLALVHNGIEIDNFLDNINKANLPVQNGDTIITCIAELHPRKGHKYLLEAFKKLQAQVPNLKLILVGSGPIEDELKEQYTSPSIHFLGWRKDIPQILKASDIFVLPSLKEAFGLVLVEAMASGILTIGTDNGGVRDIIQHGKTGLLVPPANSNKLAKTILTALQNPDQKSDIEKAAISHVQENFTAERMALDTINVYNTIK